MKKLIIVLLSVCCFQSALAIDMPKAEKAEKILSLLESFQFEGEPVLFHDDKLRVSFAESNLFIWTLLLHITATQRLEDWESGRDKDIEEFHIPFEVNDQKFILNCGIVLFEAPRPEGNIAYSMHINLCQTKPDRFWARSESSDFSAVDRWSRSTRY